MEPSRHEPSVPALVEAIASRTAPETDRLATMLRSWCWPGDGSDRHVPGALEWVRRWGPHRQSAEPLDCSCRVGRCAFCN